MEGYRCDCFGYELCKRASCSRYTTAAKVFHDTSEAFKCQLTPDAGICTDFTAIIDTVSGADNALAEAILNFGESIQEEFNIHQSIKEIKAIKLVIHDVFNKIEQAADHVPDEVIEHLEYDAHIILNATQQAIAESIISTKQSEETFMASRQVSKFKRAARLAEREATRKEEQQRVEEEKAENKENCNTCETLKVDISRLRIERKEAAIAAGT